MKPWTNATIQIIDDGEAYVVREDGVSGPAMFIGPDAKAAAARCIQAMQPGSAVLSAEQVERLRDAIADLDNDRYDQDGVADIARKIIESIIASGRLEQP